MEDLLGANKRVLLLVLAPLISEIQAVTASQSKALDPTVSVSVLGIKGKAESVL
jgi:hypothetical protein